MTLTLPPVTRSLVAPHGGMDEVWYRNLVNALKGIDDANGNIADLGTAAAEDIGTSGKKVPLLNTANQWSKQQWSPIKSLSEEQIVAGFDLDDNQTGIVTLTANRVLGNLTNAKPGGTYQLAVIASTFELTYGSMFKFPDDGDVPVSSGDCLISMFCPTDGVLWCVMAKEFA